MNNNKKIEENLVVVQYANNNSYTQAVSVADARKEHGIDFSIDIEKGIWKYDGKKFKIGSSRDCDDGQRYGVIGVYVRNSIKDWNTAVHAANRAVEHRGNCFDD